VLLELEMRYRQMVRIVLLGLEAVAVAQDEHVQIATINVFETAIAHSFAV